MNNSRFWKTGGAAPYTDKLDAWLKAVMLASCLLPEVHLDLQTFAHIMS